MPRCDVLSQWANQTLSPEVNEASHSSSVTQVIVCRVRLSGANAAAVSGSRRTAPTIGLRRPSRRRWSRSARRAHPIGFDDEEDGAPVARVDGDRLGGGGQGAAGAGQCRGAFQDLAANHVEHHVDLTHVLQLSAWRSTKASAPRSRAVSRSAARPVPITRAPTPRAQLHSQGAATARGAVENSPARGHRRPPHLPLHHHPDRNRLLPSRPHQ